VTDVELVADQGAFRHLVERLRREPVVGIDTEAASFHRFEDRVYLLQLSSASHTAVVDPLALGGLAGLEPLLHDPAVELVFHDADYDLRLLYHEYRFRVRRLFDTRVAAQFAGASAIGLGSLLEQRFGVTTDKRFQRADWSARPLTPAMIAYAATDTRYLPALRDSLRADLERLGRLSWVEEECELLTGVEWAPAEPPGTAFLRLKGARALDRRGLAVLRELVVWRAGLAERLDRALFRVIGNEALLALAAERPRTVDAVGRVRGVGRDLLARHGADVVAAIERGLAVPDQELPRFERHARPRPDPAFEARLERLRAVREALAARLALPPGLLCPNATLEAIARRVPREPAELLAVDGVRRWQVETFGRELLAAVAAAG
jgi:ribonuclease D